MVWWGRSAPEPIRPSAFRRAWQERQVRTLLPLLKNASVARRTLGPLLPHAVGVTLDSVETFSRTEPRTIWVHRETDILTITPARCKRDRPDNEVMFEAYNRTVFAERVHEILGVVANTRGKVRLKGVRTAGPAALVAAALSRKVKSVEADMCGFDPGKDRDWRRLMHTPAIRQIGGLATVLAEIGSRSLALVNASPEVRQLVRRYAR
jgi:hypothetical protein